MIYGGWLYSEASSLLMDFLHLQSRSASLTQSPAASSTLPLFIHHCRISAIDSPTHHNLLVGGRPTNQVLERFTVRLQTSAKREMCCSFSGKRRAEEAETEEEREGQSDSEVQQGLAVNLAIALIIFYKREISPLLPGSCRYVPTCSEYAIQAYKKYGAVKGTLLTAWRLSRCNPFGGSGFDPPRWFGESKPPSY